MPAESRGRFWLSNQKKNMLFSGGVGVRGKGKRGGGGKGNGVFSFEKKVRRQRKKKKKRLTLRKKRQGEGTLSLQKSFRRRVGLEGTSSYGSGGWALRNIRRGRGKFNQVKVGEGR